jgi:DNA-binding LacI/PurR family transcriptional regulator
MSSESDESYDDERRPPTMSDIAKHLGVSRQLVSVVFRDVPGASAETRRRVREAARELGFSPHLGARSLRRAKSKDLGVLFAPAHLTELEIVAAIYAAAAKRGFEVILSAHTETRPTGPAVHELVGHRCAALILIGSDLDHQGILSIAQGSQVPVVDVGYGKRNDTYDVVRSAGDKGIADMVAYVAGLGHQKIAFLDPASMPMAPLRRRGYTRAMKRLGLTADVVSEPGDYTTTNYFEEAGASVARTLLQRAELPTALVSSNDQAAAGFLQLMGRAGVRIPEDISLTGFDDATIAQLTAIDLTTVRQDPVLMGTAAVDAALRRITNPATPPQETVVPTSLIVRSSTSAPRAAGSGVRGSRG